MSTNFPPGLQCLNAMAAPTAEAEFLKCCGSPNWARQLATHRPFASFDQMVDRAEQIWWSLDESEWLQAFHSHPKIGETKAAASTSTEAQQWSESEQSGVRDSRADTMAELSRLNAEYQQKFGFIFIVCATGKSSEEILAILKERLPNGPTDEVKVAAGEQAKITKLRLHKVVQHISGTQSA